MRFRKLRIAWSVVWVLAAILLITLWVRSYWWMDPVGVTPRCLLSTIDGRFVIAIANARVQAEPGYHPRKLDGTPVYKYDDNSSRTWTILFAYGGQDRILHYVVVRLYAVVAIAFVIAAAPWMRQLKWRFSLRTLLIATTLAAVVLALIVWAAK